MTVGICDFKVATPQVLYKIYDHKKRKNWSHRYKYGTIIIPCEYEIIIRLSIAYESSRHMF